MDGPLLGDAFGAMLLAHYESVEPARVFEIIERSDGGLGVGDPGRYFALFDQWHECEQWLVARLTGRTLDIGCGPGRHALHLQERGVDVTGLDISPGAIEVCRRRGLAKTFAGSLEEFAAISPAPFDCFLLLGNNIGLLESRDAAPRFLASITALAAPRAVILGTCVDPLATTDPEHLAYHAANRAAGRLAGQLRMRVRHGRIASDWFDYLITAPAELSELLVGTGWRVAEVKSEDAHHAVILAR